jgi:WD40 repeat protein
LIDAVRGGRFLLTGAMTLYPCDPELDRPELADDVERIADVFVKDFGYRHVPLPGDSLTQDQLRDGLRDFCIAPERGEDDFVAVYLACHGAILEPNEFVLLPSDTDPKDRVRHAVTPQDLVKWLLVGTAVRRLLLMLDTCYSGQGGGDVAKAAVDWINRPGAADHTGVVVVTAAHPWQEAYPGVFSRAFKRAVANLAVGGHAPEYLPLDALFEAIKADRDMPPSQTIAWDAVSMSGGLPPFLSNPRYRPQLIDVDLLEQERARLAEQREVHLRKHFLPATRWFTGRHTALTDLAAWLNKPAAAHSTLIVTGRAGSGKTALLGLLAALSDSEQAPTVPRDGLPEAFSIAEGSITEAIYASTMATQQVRDRIAAAANLLDPRVAITTQGLIDGLRKRDAGALVVLVDALDEAADPGSLVRELLKPLMTECADTLRLLLGTRPHLLTDNLLGKPQANRYLEVDLDSERYADPASVRTYVRRILLAEDPLDSAYQPSGLYRSASEGVLDAVTEAIGQAAGSSFLVARITATTESTVAQLPNPWDRGWRAALPQHAGEAMRRDLRVRLGAEAGKAEQLLLPLAYAQGNGLPWENIWPRLVEALSPGCGYGNDELIWLRRTAGSYAVESVADGRSVYRLYHQALAEHLLEGRDQHADQQAVTYALLTLVPALAGGFRDWAAARRAHPYILAHLATHAQRAGMLDSLLLDPGYLVNAVPAGLLAALPAARDPDAELAGRAYQRAVHQLRDQPEGYRFSYLELASRSTHAAKLASRIAVSAPHRRWSVPWTHWPPEYPHQILAGNLGLINGVVCANPDDGNPVVACVGNDAKLRIWDVVTAETGGDYPVGSAPLVAIGTARLPEHRTVIVLLAADGMLHTWDMSTAKVLRTTPVVPFWRRTARLRNAELTLRCLVAPDGQQFAVVGGHGIRTSIWNLLSGHRVALLPPPVTPEAIEFIEPIDGRIVIAASMGGGERWVYDLLTGQESYQRAEDANSLVPFGARGPDQSDHESRESLSLRFKMTGRFLRVEFRDYLVESDRGAISLTLAGHTAEVTGYDWTRLSDGHVIVVTASHDGTVRRWDISSIAPGSGEENEQARVALHRIVSVPLEDGTPLGLTIADGTDVAIWDLRTGVLVGDLQERTAPPCAIGIARRAGNSTVAVTFDADEITRIWNLPDGRQIAHFPADRIHWPSDAAFTHLPDGTCIAVTSGSGRKTVVWDLATGRIRNVLTGHKGWSACVTCAEGRGPWPLALTGGHDNRVNVWDLRRGRRRNHFRIVPPWTLLTRPWAGHADAVRTMSLDRGRILVLVATSDGMVRALEPRRFSWGARRTGAVPANAVATATLSDGRAVVVTARADGIIWIWKPEAFTHRRDDKALLCEINIEVPVSDISVIGHDTFVFATPNGLTAIRLDAGLLEKNVTSLEFKNFH